MIMKKGRGGINVLCFASVLRKPQHVLVGTIFTSGLNFVFLSYIN